jgi:hypothetical protein
METQMQRRLLYTVATTVAALAVFTGAASASGPAPPSKELVELTCEGIGPVTLSVPPGEQSKGAGQIVGAKGHGIAVSNTAIATDLTTGKVVQEASFARGNGNAHPNQPTTKCSGVVFKGLASEIGGVPPEGVEPTDEIEVTVVVDVITKP